MSVRPFLFHVTPGINIPSIRVDGILPSYATGKMQVVWLANSEALMWALAHVANKKRVLIEQLMVCVCQPPGELIKRTRWNGIFNLSCPVVPLYTVTAQKALDDYEQKLKEKESRRS